MKCIYYGKNIDIVRPLILLNYEKKFPNPIKNLIEYININIDFESFREIFKIKKLEKEKIEMEKKLVNYIKKYSEPLPYIHSPLLKSDEDWLSKFQFIEI